MSDIFISYNNKDKAKAELFARAFEQQRWSVFWDKAIPPGKTFDQYIDEQLNAAKCVVVLWSEGSVNSDWVKEEAQRGVQRKILIPVFINRVSPPLGFGRIEAAELFEWQGDTSEVEFQNLLKAIKNLIQNHANQGALAEQTPPSNVSPPFGSAAVSARNPPAAPGAIISPAATRKYKKYAFSGLASSAALTVVFLAWQYNGDVKKWISSKNKEEGSSGIVVGPTVGWGVVLGSDVSVAAALDVFKSADANGIPQPNLYLRNGYYASIAVVNEQEEAKRILEKAKTFRSDAYLTSMDTWCRNPQRREGFVECQSRK